MKHMQFVAKSQILRALLTKMALSPPPKNSSSGELRWVDHMSRIIHNDVKIDINELGGCIFEVPKSIRSFKPEAYTPQLLALGPYHHFLPELYQMQLAKLYAAKEVLKLDQLLNFEQLMIDDPKELELPIRVFYNKYLNLDPNTLAWILAIDGLFLLHFFSIDMHNEDHFAGGKLKINAVIADIMMLEDQIPIILLERIQRTLSSYGDFVELQSSWKTVVREMREPEKDYVEYSKEIEENVGQIIHVATDLGIPGGIRDIQFDEKELTFYLLVITLNVNSEVILRNLVAYKVLSAKPESTLEFAQYVDLMSGIINDVEDARLLKEADIIKGSLTDEEIASLFNRIDKVTKKPSEKTELEKIVDKTNEYFDSRSRVKLSNFMKKYVYTSWKFLTIFSTILLITFLVLHVFCEFYDFL
ncbi:hypothetical protein F0562_030249 [Nyssa sinensis]|uniref:Uncharacterized protein n=1 Tax=Nyssa sinensis TaxID=561372 RepID=A0A5J5AZG9_9ASTE|nr:hypothetical protein F0562_030249 [Nyssa sinensis]